MSQVKITSSSISKLQQQTIRISDADFIQCIEKIKQNEQSFISIDISEINLNSKVLLQLKDALNSNKFIGYINWPNTNDKELQEIKSNIIEILKDNIKSHKYFATDLEHALLSLHIYKDCTEGQTPYLEVIDLLNDYKELNLKKTNAEEILKKTGESDKIKRKAEEISNEINSQIEKIERELVIYNKILQNWKISKVFEFVGGSAQLYKKDNQTVLAYRGFTFQFKDLIKKGSSIKGGIEGAVRGNIILQHEQVYNIMSQLNSKQEYLSITGYNFGGWLAEISIFFALKEFEYDYRKIKAVSFESLGSESVLQQFQQNIQNKYTTRFDVNDLNIVGYLTVPTPLNSLNKHIGIAYSLSIESSTSQKAGKVIQDIKLIKEKMKKIYDIKSNYLESKVLGASTIFASSLPNILGVFELESGQANRKYINMIKDWPKMNNIKTKKKEDCFDSLKNGVKDALKSCFVPTVVAGVVTTIASVAVKELIGETTIYSIASIISDIMDGSIDTSQYWKVFENMEIVDGRYKISENAKRFGLKFEGHYETCPVPYTKDILSKQNTKGDIEWLLCKLYKNREIVMGDSQLENKEQIITAINAYKIDEQEKYIELENTHFFKSIEELKTYVNRLFETNNILNEKIQTGKIINNIQNKLDIVFKKIEHIILIDDLVINIPIPKDPKVVQRQNVYKQINDLFETEQVISLKGFGGLGKSTAAAMYGRNQSEMGYVVQWFYADNGLEDDYDLLCAKLNIDIQGQGEIFKREQIELRLSKSSKKFLFIFDNVNLIEHVESYTNNLPKNVKVVITTRQFFNQYKNVDLSEFTEKEAIDYLKGAIIDKKYTEADLKELIKTVSTLPLRLALASGYLNSKKLINIKKYIENYNDLSKKSGDIKLHTGKSDKALNITSIMSLETLEGGEINFLVFASYLNPDFIPITIFEKLGQNEEDIEKSMEILRKLSLVSWVEGNNLIGLRMHRLVQEETKMHCFPGFEQDKVIPQLINVSQVYDEEEWQNAKEYIHHIETLLLSKNQNQKQSLIVDDDQTAQTAELFIKLGAYYAFIKSNYDFGKKQMLKGLDILKDSNQDKLNLIKGSGFNSIAYLFEEQGKYEEAFKYYNQSLEIRKQVYGENHAEVAQSFNSIGLLFYHQGKYDEALKYHNQSLEIRKQVCGENHADVANSFNNIGLLFRTQGKYDESLKYFNQTLEIEKQLYGENHKDVASSLNDIGQLFLDQGKYDEALKYYNHSLEIQKQVYGENHVEVALSYNHIGQLFHQLGKYEDALKYYHQSLDIYKQVYGENHQDVALIFNNIGSLFSHQGKNNEALKYHNQSLEITKQIFGENHAVVASSFDNIAQIFENQGKYDEALKYYYQSLEIRKQLYGENHEDVAQSFHSIGSLFQSQGKYDQSLKYINQSLEIRKQVYGENHAEVAQCNLFLGYQFKNQGKYDEALQYYNHSLEIYKQVYGENHPDVAQSFFIIGDLFSQQGKYEEALKYYKHSLEIRKQVYGENHAAVATSFHFIGLLFNNLRKYEEALKYYYQSLEIRKQIFGENHIDVASSFIQIGELFSKQGKYDEALKYYNKTFEIRKQVYGENHSEVAEIFNCIGQLYFMQAKYDEALKYHNQSLEIRKQEYGENHPHVAVSYYNIGLLFHGQGKYDEALKYHNQTLQIQKQIYGENHEDVAASFNNIGLIFQEQGKYEEAVKYLNQALEIRKQVYGENHADVASSFHNIGLLLSNQEKYDEALKYYNQSLEIRKQIYGENNDEVAQSLNNIGVLFFDQGKYDEALQYYNQSLEIRKQVYGENHANVAQSFHNIGFLFSNQGKYDEAFKYYNQSLEIRKQVYGENHADVPSYLHSIGLFFHNQENYDEALKYYNHSLEIRKLVFGENHIDVAQSLTDIGSLLEDQGKYDQALKYYNQSLEIEKQLFGENHENVASSFHNIGQIFQKQGKYDEALKYYNHSLEINKQVFGENHADVASSFHVIALIFENQGKYDEALKYYNRSLEIRKQLYGENHESVVDYMKNINKVREK